MCKLFSKFGAPTPTTALDVITQSWKAVRTFLNLALRRINLLCEQKILDSSLGDVYWDFSAQYFSPWIDRAFASLEQAEKTCSELDESIEALEFDTSRSRGCLETTSALPDSQIGAVECAQMIVRDGGIAFNALLKHTDIYVTTAEISKQMIESALASATN